MGTKLIRFRSPTEIGHQWGIVEGTSVRPLKNPYATTKALFIEALSALQHRSIDLENARPLDELELLSPITHPCKIIAQATNYGDHVREVGLDPSARASNVLFRKSSASICGPYDSIVRPSHVRLLDYEIELGLVIGASNQGPRTVEAAELSHYVAGFIVANDVSARDVQIPDGQFYKGKSYRTFCPLGPYLYLTSPAELARWPELQLTLRVNQEVRQNAHVREMIHRPAETLSEVMSVEDLDPGDVILTGTPGGVALAPPKKPLRAVAELLPERVKWNMFIEGQAKNPRYLKPGDRIDATIRTPDGQIDLGSQHNLVR